MVCIVLFACMQNIAIGYRVDYVHDYAAAVEETFRTVLGLGFMDLTSVFPDGLYVSRIEAVMGILLSYGRQLLFVYVLAQYFMATLGDVFSDLKEATAGVKGSSIGRDITKDVCPEIRSKLRRLLKGRKYSTTGRDRLGGAVEVPAGSEALRDFIKALYPHLISSKKFGDRVSALPVGTRYLDLDTFQQLLTELAMFDHRGDGRVSNLLTQQRRPARAYQRQAVAVLAAIRCSGSDFGDTAPQNKDPAAVAAPSGSSTEVEVVGAAAAVAAVLAAAEQLMGSLGKAVDANELTEAQLQLSEAMEMVGVAQDLKAGVDFTADGLQAVFERELELHRQIYAAIWSAVTAMECWSTGVNRWLARVTNDCNSWLATNAHVAAQTPSATAGPYMGYVPIPLPAQVDLRPSRTTLELLAPLADGQSLQLQQQSDEKEQSAFAEAVQSAPMGVRLGADLGTTGVDCDAQLVTPAPFNPRSLVIANQWVSNSGDATPASGMSPGPRWGSNTRTTSSGVTLDLQRSLHGDRRAPSIGWQRLTSNAGRDMPQSPGGVSLHSRFAGQPPTPAGRSGVMATLSGFLGGQGADATSSEPSSSTAGTEVTTVPSVGAVSSRQSATVEHLGFTSSSVVDTQGCEVMTGSAVAGGEGVSAGRVSQAERLPTVTGRTRNRLQPIE